MAALKQTGEAERFNSYLGPFADQADRAPWHCWLSFPGWGFRKRQDPHGGDGSTGWASCLARPQLFPHHQGARGAEAAVQHAPAGHRAGTLCALFVVASAAYCVLLPGIEQVWCVLVLCWPAQHTACCCLVLSRYDVCSFCVGQRSILRAAAWYRARHIVCCRLASSTTYCMLLSGIKQVCCVLLSGIEQVRCVLFLWWTAELVGSLWKNPGHSLGEVAVVNVFVNNCLFVCFLSFWSYSVVFSFIKA